MSVRSLTARWAHRALPVFAALALVAASGGAQPATEWTPDLMLQTARVSGARPSPDGRRVLYTVSTPVMTDDRSEFVSQLWIAGADGSGARALTAHPKGGSAPRWSPDGRTIAFLSSRTGAPNVFLMSPDGGEPVQLTAVSGGVLDFAWAPDGRTIAVTATDAPPADDEARKRSRDDWFWVDETPRLARLHLVDATQPVAAPRAPRRLGTLDRHVTGFEWAPDGRELAAVHQSGPLANWWPTGQVSLVDVASGAWRRLTQAPGAQQQVTWAPDGRTLALVVSDGPARWAQSDQVVVVPRGGDAEGAPRRLPLTYDATPQLVGFTADGRQLLILEPRRTLAALYAMDVATGSTRNLAEGSPLLVGDVALNAARTMVGLAGQGSDVAPEAWVTPLARFAPVRVSAANQAPRPPIGRTEVVRWTSPDGREIEGLLTYPVGHVAGTRVPLLTLVHGGPAGVHAQSYLGVSSASYPVAAFSSRGYAVLRPNPRGSGGYGTEFRRANLKDWGGGDYQDIQAGVDALIARGLADSTRLGIMGWSYGGFMTSWTITQTTRFRAASIGAPVTHPASFDGTSDIPDFIPDYFGGRAWDVPDEYRKHSPLLHAGKARTPSLIQHGDADVRVPISQGYEFFNALQRQGVPSRMQVFPRQGHGLTEPRMLRARMQANLDWFAKYIPAGRAVSVR
jgi:dipeptidyl aminopeptidase/acylaminoacyl peptidase